ncbi:GNAT family N-acetyltransferase [Photorhabdus heterorhabditis]|uniref:GNAT family N-acetyltransferase n=1 Tax=Photorhabdus heterorhabditis TaxID=880156 RepID=UPI001BD47043|nr:GNAT family N-acetyltransferase [Photorhabdus heterorhabditis]MBS9443544.1 GNAT family N-acetyltransferase [Photorhabdus heterorhabditis]
MIFSKKYPKGSIRRFISGWKECSFERYQQAYSLYGGGISTHPNVVRFLNEKFGNSFIFYVKENPLSANIIEGAYFTCKDHHLAASHQKDYNFFSYDEIIFPIAKYLKTIIPGKSKTLSVLHKENFINAHYGRLNKRTICLAKEDFSYKTRRNRSNEINKFKRSGGEICQIDDFTCQEFVDIYTTLYEKRWAKQHNEKEKEKLIELYTELKQHLYGSVLTINGTPVAYDLVIKSDSPQWISFDAINGGFDPEYSNLSLGSIVMWLNIRNASDLCQQQQKTMRYSIGRPSFAYKDRWCNRHPLARTLF